MDLERNSFWNIKYTIIWNKPVEFPLAFSFFQFFYQTYQIMFLKDVGCKAYNQ